MSDAAKQYPLGDFTFSSSLAGDVWHRGESSEGYQQWYFDAISDDGSEAVVIGFHDNLIYSLRYNRKLIKGGEAGPRSGSVPAVSFVYYRNGKTLYRAVTEYLPENFTAERAAPGCEIGECSFRLEPGPYGSGFMIHLEAALARRRRVEATFEWLLIEEDLAAETSGESYSHHWNLVAPRSDVTGRITLFDRRGQTGDVRHFRGTGYHDNSSDDRWLPAILRQRYWGRAHFADSTAVFYRYCEQGDCEPVTKLLTVKNGELRERDAKFEERGYVRDRFGMSYPTRLTLTSDDNMRLRVKPLSVIDSSSYNIRVLSEMTLTLRDGKPRKNIGITEFLTPKALKYRWLDWLNDLRIGKKGKGPVLR